MRRKRLRLRRREIVGAECVFVALARCQRRVEAHADHVDDLVLGEDRNASEADVGQVAADMRVDIVFGDKLLDFAAAGVGLRLVVRDDELDRPAEDAARLVDAIDGHLQTDQRRLAAECGNPRERLLGADPVGFRLRQREPQRHRRDDRRGPGRCALQRAPAGHSALIEMIQRHAAPLCSCVPG